MYEGKDKFTPVTIAKTTHFPILVNKNVKDIETVTIIKKNYGSLSGKNSNPLDDKEILVAFNADLEVFMGTGRHTNQLKISHPFARDIEGDTSLVACLDLDAVALVSAYDSSVEYSAYLTSMLFYADEKNSPFTDAVKLDDSEDTNANYGYPYMPPQVEIESFSLPASVTITHYYITNDVMRKQVVNKFFKPAKKKAE